MEHDCLHITIEDDGLGLPDNPDENVFEPFFTTKKTFQGAGLGLGLPVCKSLADAMGGSVSLRPRDTGGVSALACLPLALGDELLGVVYADSRSPGAVVTRLDLELLEAFAERATLWLAARQHQAALASASALPSKEAR